MTKPQPKDTQGDQGRYENNVQLVVGDSPYILIGSAGTELKAKNIYKKGHKSLKTVSYLYLQVF